jgi:anthranilate/para-aminobenzoate synthase component I
VYQVNLTLRAQLAPVDGASLLATLCARGVPRFAAWVKAPQLEFISASPELLFEADHGTLRAEPMKGTAPAGQRAWLEASEKDQAELAMITDLLRNDLAQLCQPGSVQVPNARRFIELPYVVQAVSDVTGTLRDDVTLDDVLRGLHPGGSVTGAPREAAVRLITQLEATPRGPYCGALLLRTGVELTRCALLIRTATRTPTGWTWGVGGGITWGSQAQAELDEVRLKLGALRTT